MPRIARLVVKGEPAVYHVISRTALDGFVLGDIEKDFLLKLIKRLSSVYFSEVLGFCVMGNLSPPCSDASGRRLFKGRYQETVYSVLWQRPCKDVQGWTSSLFQGEMVESF